MSGKTATGIIESLSYEGRGITYVNGKKVFVHDALPNEEVLFRYTKRQAKYDEAYALKINNPALQRVSAKCRFFGICGGCSLQHLKPQSQLEHKQSVLLEQLKRIAGIRPQSVLPPLTGPIWGYRRRARLGVKYVRKKQRVLVGFRERYSPFITDMSDCEVLHPSVNLLLMPLQDLVSRLALVKQIPQIEVAVGSETTALIFRHLQPLTSRDEAKLKAFAKQHGIAIYGQSGGLETVTPLVPNPAKILSYSLDEHGLRLAFQPNHFIQINHDINRVMIQQVLDLLEVNKQDHVLDLFCGIGNFTLPLAIRAATVLGLDSDLALVKQAAVNAKRNRLGNTTFKVINLVTNKLDSKLLDRSYNKVLLDPPRTGAREIIGQTDFSEVAKIAYISCNAATLARDAKLLIRGKHFRLMQVGIMDMFPHTDHFESVALFSKDSTLSHYG